LFSGFHFSPLFLPSSVVLPGLWLLWPLLTWSVPVTFIDSYGADILEGVCRSVLLWNILPRISKKWSSIPERC
jgi:hypothetical protein